MAPLTENDYNNPDDAERFDEETRHDVYELKLGEPSLRHLPLLAQSSLHDTTTFREIERSVSRRTTDRVEKLFRGSSQTYLEEITTNIRRVRSRSLSKSSISKQQMDSLAKQLQERLVEDDDEEIIHTSGHGRNTIREMNAMNTEEEEKIEIDGKKYTLEELRQEYASCCSFTLKWGKATWKAKSIYLPVVVQIWDVAMDFAVTYTYFDVALKANEPDKRLRLFVFAVFGVFVLLNYRVMSAFSIHRLTNKCKLAAAQFMDVLIYYEVYTSHVKGQVTPNLRWIQKMQAILESAPQALMQIVFVMTNVNLSTQADFTLYLSMVWSVMTVTMRLINDDERVMFSHKWTHCPKYIRSLFRLSEVFGRILYIGLIWIVLGFQWILGLLAVQFLALVMFFRNGMLGYEPWNVLGFLFAVSDIGIEQNFYMNPYLHEEICMCCCGCCFCFWATLCIQEKQPNDEFYFPRLTVQFIIARTIEQFVGIAIAFQRYRSLISSPNPGINVGGTFVLFVICIFCTIMCPILLFVMVRLKDFNPKSSGQRNPFDLIKGNHLEEMYLLHVAGANLTEFTDNDSNSPLHYASHYGNQDITAFLIRIGCEPGTVDHENNTPLHYACANLSKAPPEDNYLVIQFLIQTKIPRQDDQHEDEDSLADIAADLKLYEYVNEKNDDGNTPFHLACGNGNVPAVNLLLERQGDLKISNNRGMSAIHFAAHSGSVEIINSLLTREEIDLTEKDNVGMMPLHYAVLSSYVNIVQRLLEEEICKENINARDKYGRTPFYSACDHGEVEIGQVLLDHGADYKQGDNQNRVPAGFAISNKELRVLFPKYNEKKEDDATLRKELRSMSKTQRIAGAVGAAMNSLKGKVWTPTARSTTVPSDLEHGFPDVDLKTADSFGPQFLNAVNKHIALTPISFSADKSDDRSAERSEDESEIMTEESDDRLHAFYQVESLTQTETRGGSPFHLKPGQLSDLDEDSSYDFETEDSHKETIL